MQGEFQRAVRKALNEKEEAVLVGLKAVYWAAKIIVLKCIGRNLSIKTSTFALILSKYFIISSVRVPLLKEHVDTNNSTL